MVESMCAWVMSSMAVAPCTSAIRASIRMAMRGAGPRSPASMARSGLVSFTFLEGRAQHSDRRVEHHHNHQPTHEIQGHFLNQECRDQHRRYSAEAQAQRGTHAVASRLDE